MLHIFGFAAHLWAHSRELKGLLDGTAAFHKSMLFSSVLHTYVHSTGNRHSDGEAGWGARAEEGREPRLLLLHPPHMQSAILLLVHGAETLSLDLFNSSGSEDKDADLFILAKTQSITLAFVSRLLLKVNILLHCSLKSRFAELFS